VNVLFVTLDQFRADCLSAAGHPVVHTPHLDRLCREGVRFASQFSQAAPCAPGRASLYTGMYQMNHRVVANGSPLESRFDNIARLGRRAGFEPALFGYTDQGIDPTVADGPADPWLDTYEGILPGFDPVLSLDGRVTAWLERLESLGYDTLAPGPALVSEPDRPAEHGVSAFMTDRLLEWVASRDEPWFAHASYLRPHPPYAAPGHWSHRYRPEDMPAPIPLGEVLHPLHRSALSLAVCAAPTDPGEMARLQAQYFGMVSAVDEQVGRIIEFLKESGRYDETVIVVTADHAEQLGDHGLIQKLGYFEQSYRVLSIVRHPGHPEGFGRIVDRFTEGIDLLPTLAEVLGQDVPVQCDGGSLLPFLRGEDPEGWRTAAHYEWDWRDMFIGPHRRGGAVDRSLERYNLAVERNNSHAYVQFADGSWLCFDLAADPSWHTTTADPSVVLPLAQSMLTWRSTHLGGPYTQLLLGSQRRGRWPELDGVASA